MAIRCFLLLVLILATVISGCAQVSSNSRDGYRIADIDNETPVLKNKNFIAPTYTGSLRNYQEYLADNENILFRREALRRLAELELEVSEKANKQLSDQNTEEMERSVLLSIEHYTSYLKTYPDNKGNDYVLYQLAKAYEYAGDIDNTLLTLDELIKSYPETEYADEIQFRRGEILFIFEDYLNAELAYADIVKHGDSSQFLEQAQYKLTWSLFKQSKYIDALENCIVILDREQEKGTLANGSIASGIKRSESDFIYDVLRVASLSLSYKSGTDTIQALLKGKQRKSYEPLLYQNLSELYLKTERTLDAANVYLDYVSLYPHTLQAAQFNIQAIEIYSSAGLAELLLKAKSDFVKNFGVGTVFWNSYSEEDKQGVSVALKTSIHDLANYYHALARKSSKPYDYNAASFWYKEYIRSFPEDSSTPRMNFLLAESLYDARQYHLALGEYLKTAYDYKLHGKSAESGYAAILTYGRLLEQVSKQVKAALEAEALTNAIQFSLTFKDSSHAPAVAAKTAESLYQNKEYKRAVEFARKNTHLINRKDQSHYKIIWLVYAHALFELKEYAAAEKTYKETRDLLAKNDKRYKDVSERLAASIYMQAKTFRDLKDYKLASHHFLRVGQLAPDSKIYVVAEYDAAAALIQLKSWVEVTRILEDFRIKFPKNKQYSQGITEKLVLAYTETGQLEKAAGEALHLSAILPNKEERRVYIWLAAELYQKSGADKKSNEVYINYIKKYPEPFGQNIEAHQCVIDYFRKNQQLSRLKEWQQLTVKAELRGKNNRTDQTKLIAANAALELAGPLLSMFKQAELVVPLKKSLRTKKKLMENALKSYSELIAYGISDITTESTYHVADIYGHFAVALLNSQRPDNLNEEELEQYNILLEDQAYPFEEKAIDIHSANARRTSSGHYDIWVKKSIEALALLQPVRYSKTERVETYVTNSH